MGCCIKHICDVSSGVSLMRDCNYMSSFSYHDCSLTLDSLTTYFQICLARNRSRLVRESFQYLEFAHEFKEYPIGIVSRQFVVTIVNSFFHYFLHHL